MQAGGEALSYDESLPRDKTVTFDTFCQAMDECLRDFMFAEVYKT